MWSLRGLLQEVTVSIAYFLVNRKPLDELNQAQSHGLPVACRGLAADLMVHVRVSAYVCMML
jgi:hypothetical protein